MGLRRFACLVIVLVFLIGCGRAQPGAPTLAPAFPANPVAAMTLASAIAKMATETPPASAPAPYPAPGAATTPSTVANAYPGAGQGTPPGLLPEAAATATPGAATPGAAAVSAATPGAAPSSYHDCARTPGLVGCDAQATPLAGRLAFADAAAGRIVALDLTGGQGWQAPLQASWLDWSPDGKALLAAWGEQSYTVYSAQGQPRDTFTAAPGAMTRPTWLADSSLSREGAVAAADGTLARLEYTPEMTWLLHIQPAQGQERVLGLEPQPTDRLYQIATWAPDGSKLLVQRYYASNSAMLLGGEVVEVDTTSGAMRSLNITAPLDPEATFAWRPGEAKPALLALIASGGPIMGARRLALLDAATGKVSNPLPEGIDVSGLDWRPDGKTLAFSAAPGETAPAEAKEIFSGPGIYQLDPQTGAVTRLVAAPEGAIDAWPHWTADGKALLYARVITMTSSGGAMAQVRAYQDGRDWTVVDGLPAPGDTQGAAWASLVAFGR